MRFVMFRDSNGMWRWKLLAANNRSIAVSGEGYHNEADCASALELIQTGAASAAVVVDVTKPGAPRDHTGKD
jgi:uncharacterized protein YegP (UPF0339 family)